MNDELKEDESAQDENSNEKIAGRFRIQEVNEDDIAEDSEPNYKTHKKSCSFSHRRFYYAVMKEDYPEEKPDEFYIYDINSKSWRDIQDLYIKLKRKNKKIEDELMQGMKTEAIKKIESYSISPFKKLETPKKKLYKSFEMEIELNQKVIDSLELDSPIPRKRVKYKHTTPNIPIIRRLSTNVMPLVKSASGVYKSKLCSLATGLLRIGNKKVREVNLIIEGHEGVKNYYVGLQMQKNISFTIIPSSKLCNGCLSMSTQIKMDP